MVSMVLEGSGKAIFRGMHVVVVAGAWNTANKQPRLRFMSEIGLAYVQASMKQVDKLSKSNA